MPRHNRPAQDHASLARLLAARRMLAGASGEGGAADVLGDTVYVCSRREEAVKSWLMEGTVAERRAAADDHPRARSTTPMPWMIEYTDEFGAWWTSLNATQQDDTDSVVGLLEVRGPQLGFPYSSGLVGSKHAHMRELRVQSSGHPLHIFYAFDPRRTAILLIGGDKTGDDRFYETSRPIADRLYDAYLEELRREGRLP